ncbi:MAG: DUF1997 domain-containing protein [Leptolyngbyaceae cyanobacterium MO_188.B28]|nr:DUF1997 domain-containing protein [Leptolyngbyaceae cyanobacterium MO_188.B28]
MRHFHVSQTLRMTVSKTVLPIEQYLHQPQRVIQAITDPKQIEQIAPSLFRLQLRPLQFMMLKIQPIVDLKVWTQADGTLHLQSLACDLRGAESLQKSFTLKLEGKLSPHQAGTTTELRGKADLEVQVEVPSPLRLMPEAALKTAGSAFLNGILLTIKYRLEHQLMRDYHRWVKEQSLEPKASTMIPMPGLTS